MVWRALPIERKTKLARKPRRIIITLDEDLLGCHLALSPASWTASVFHGPAAQFACRSDFLLLLASHQVLGAWASFSSCGGELPLSSTADKQGQAVVRAPRGCGAAAGSLLSFASRRARQPRCSGAAAPARMAGSALGRGGCCFQVQGSSEAVVGKSGGPAPGSATPADFRLVRVKEDVRGAPVGGIVMMGICIC
jgi:hypothetical protein